MFTRSRQNHVDRGGIMIGSSPGMQNLIRFDSWEPSPGRTDNPFTRQVVQDRIGRQLRDMYSDLMQQPLPPDLVELIEQLEREFHGERE
jgi:hypothetical protein